MQEGFTIEDIDGKCLMLRILYRRGEDIIEITNDKCHEFKLMVDLVTMKGFYQGGVVQNYTLPIHIVKEKDIGVWRF